MKSLKMFAGLMFMIPSFLACAGADENSKESQTERQESERTGEKGARLTSGSRGQVPADAEDEKDPSSPDVEQDPTADVEQTPDSPDLQRAPTSPGALLARDPVAYIDEARDHTGDPWIACRTTTKEVATDPLGPVISHGFIEAPGYQVGALDADQARVLRRARMHKFPLSEGFIFDSIYLPASATDAAVSHAIEGAIRVAGWPLRGDLKLAHKRNFALDPREARQLPSNLDRSRLPQSEWVFQVAHNQIPITGLLCLARVATQGEPLGSISCWLPRQVPTSFESFQVSGQSAEQVARQLIGMNGGRAMSKSFYHLSGQTGRARTAVLLYDGKIEVQVIVDGQGAVVSRKRTERDFKFPGYALDYTDGLQNITSAMDVGAGQLAQGFIDSAPAQTGQMTCVNPGALDSPSGKRGIVICGNAILETPGATYGKTLPRLDGDHTNAAGSPDMFGPQNTKVTTAPGSGTQTVTAASLPSSTSNPAFAAWGGAIATPQQAAAGWAELQAFHTLGRRASIYRRFNHAGMNDNDYYGAKYRLEVKVHQKTNRSNVDLQYPNVSATFAGLNAMSLGDLKFIPETVGDPGPPITMPDNGNQAFEVVADASIVSHEFHHHVQYELSWDLRNSLTYDESDNNNQDDYISMAEGMADMFGAIAVRRTMVGLLANPATPDPCAQTSYPHVNNTDLTRAACNDNFYPGSYANNNWYERGAAIFGAGYKYTSAKVGPFEPSSPGLADLQEAASISDMYEAERVFLATNSVQCNFIGDTACNLRRILESLYLGVLYTDPLDPTLTNGPPPDPNTSTETRRRRHHAATAFAAKGMTLAFNNYTECGPLSCSGPASNGEGPKIVALRSLAASSVYAWEPNQPTPTFDIFTPTGTDYEQSSGQNRVTLEASGTSDFQSPFTKTLTVPPPTNNAKAGSFQYTPSQTDWNAIKLKGEQSPTRHLFYRVKLCLAGGSDCVYTAQTGTFGNSNPFIYFTPAAQQGGCSCQQVAVPSLATLPGLGAVALAAAALMRRRRAS